MTAFKATSFAGRTWSLPKLETARSTLLVSDPNRLIGLGRLITACFAILACWLDPTQPARYRIEAQHLLIIYLCVSVGLVLIPMRRPVDSPLHLVAHMIDTAILGSLAYLTNELTSPFFSFLPFTLMAMTMRWGLGGAIMGAMMVEVVLYAVGIPDILDGESELNVLITRSTSLVLAALMLGYFGAYRESSRARLTRLARWPMEPALGDRRAWLEQMCRHAASVTESERMVVIWHEQETADAYAATFSGGRVDLCELRRAHAWEEFDKAVLGRSGASGGRDARVLRQAEMLALAPMLRRAGLKQIDMHSIAVTCGFSGLRLAGSVLIIDPRCRPEEAVMLCGIIATRIGAEMERLDLVIRHADNVRTEERVRLAQDLHDSVLQDLTATTLKLRALAAQAPSEMRRVLEIESLVVDQQRRIRRFVEDHRDGAADMLVEVADELRRHAVLLEKKWDVVVPFVWHGKTAMLPSWLVEDLIQLVSEATANAVRHGAASSVRLRGRLASGGLELTVADNGIGLPTHASGSASLRARLQHLGGAMSMNNEASGLSLRLVVPVEDRAA